MNLKDIHFHDSVIHRVTENPDDDSLVFEVDYPVDSERGSYKRRCIKFIDVLNYQVHEIPFSGKPTFLEWSVVGNENGRNVIRLDTNAGYRQLAFKTVTLSEAT